MKQLMPILLGFFLLSSTVNAQTAGNALDFDGVDDYVDCPLPSIFNSIGTSEFTIELWANPTVGTFERLFYAQRDVSNFASISITTAGEILFYLEENGQNHSVLSTSVLNPLEWAHIAVTWNSGSLESRIFINGSEVQYAGGLNISSTGTDNKMTIGSKTDGSQSFTGEMDELAIWSTAKSECEVSFEMNDKKEGTEANLVAYFNFDYGIADGSNPGVDDLQDESLNGNDGTLFNFALSGSTSNWTGSVFDVNRWWGEVSTVFIGQLGLVSTINADQFQWIYCDDLTPVSGAIGVTFDPPTQDPNYTGVGDFYAVISTKGNCVDTSGCFNVNGDALSIGEVDLASMVSIYPNPSQGSVFIESALDIKLIEVRSVTGELVEIVHPTMVGSLEVQLAKENGLYLLIVHTSAGLLTKKIIVHNN